MSHEEFTDRLKTRRFLLAAVIAAILIWVWAFWPRQPVLTITFLDVHQGDCAVIRTPSGKTVLIDAGGAGNYDVGSRVVAPFLRRNGIRTLDLVVMTHPHQDHIGGMYGVLKNVNARAVLDSGAPHASESYERTLRLIKQKSIRYRLARRGQKISFPDGVKIDVLHPGDEEMPDLNNRSVVLRMTYGSASFLFTGDAEHEAEDDMLKNCGRVRSTVLKVGHHGSAQATTEPWLKAVKPSIAVISVGRSNQFGHPAFETLQRLTDSSARILRTDRDGAVTITTDGKRLHVTTTRRP
ncbi:MAG: MBL fold metallo-hydrolase [Armatimonadota bacterium]|nr:MBL fold metallo-hydrolase [Armatimonadota bacterium]